MTRRASGRGIAVDGGPTGSPRSRRDLGSGLRDARGRLTVARAGLGVQAMGIAKPSPWRPFLWTLAVLCLAYLPLFFGSILFFRDIAHWSFPARAFVRDSLLAGELPRWNPYQALGFSVFADPLYGVFYPPNWLFLLVGRDWVASLFNWQCFLHLAWGALGVCFLARRLRASATGTTVAGLAWALSGYVTSQWSSGLLLFADAWVPWAAVGQVALLDSLRAGGPGWRRGLVKAALPTVFACLFGELFLALIGAGFGVAFACLVYAIERGEESSGDAPGDTSGDAGGEASGETSSRASPSRGRLRWLAAGVAAVVLAFGVGAVVIVPAGAALAGTERATLSRELAEVCSLHPLRLLEFIAPQSMGDAYTVFPAASIVGEARLDGLPLSYSMYLGASVVALALAAFARRRRLALGLGLAATLALLIAFGRYTPVHGLFRRLVFPLSYMRYPEKYAIVVVTVAAMLAGLGADRVLSARRQPWRRTLVLLLMLLGFAVVAATRMPAPWNVFALHGALMGTVAVVAVLAVQFLAARKSRLAPPLLLSAVALDLALAAWPLQTFGPRQLAQGRPPAADQALKDRIPGAAPPRLYRSHQTSESVNRYLPASATHPSNAQTEFKLRQTLITNTANAWGIATLPGYDAAIPALVDEVWKRGLEVGQQALRLLGADYAILPASPGAPADDRPGLVPIFDPLPGARMYRVPNALPRVYWARHAEVLRDPDALARLYHPDVVSGASVVLAPEGDVRPLPQPPGRAGACSLESYANARLVATCSGAEAGVAVFVEQFDRGWQASVDGRAVPLARANLIMRGLPLGPGNHRIVLEYHTPGLVPGLLVSGISAGLLLLLALWGSRRPRLPKLENPSEEVW